MSALAIADRLALADVERRLLRACKTLRALPDREARFQVMRSSNWPPIVHELADAYGYTDAPSPRFQPTPHDVSDCLIALAWTRPLEKPEFKLIWWRSFDISFRHIGIRMHRSDELARQRYRDAIQRVWIEASSLKR